MKSLEEVFTDYFDSLLRLIITGNLQSRVFSLIQNYYR